MENASAPVSTQPASTHSTKVPFSELPGHTAANAVIGHALNAAVVDVDWDVRAGVGAEVRAPGERELRAQIPRRPAGLHIDLAERNVTALMFVEGVGLDAQGGVVQQQRVNSRPAGYNHHVA